MTLPVTRAVNIRVESYDVYVGRAGKGQTGYFGNPYRVGDFCLRCGDRHMHNASALPCFEAYMRERLAKDRQYREAVRGLRGKRLGCFCKPAPCHADVLAAAAEALACEEGGK
jgi:hypothetical protein